MMIGKFSHRFQIVCPFSSKICSKIKDFASRSCRVARFRIPIIIIQHYSKKYNGNLQKNSQNFV